MMCRLPTFTMTAITAIQPCRSAIATAAGFLAILFWSTSLATSRHVGEQVGAITAGMLSYGGAGLAGIIALATTGRLRAVLALPGIYLLSCGTCCALYSLTLYLAIHLCRDRLQLVTVSILQYIWPGMVMVLGIPILGHKVRPGLLIPGIIFALAGVALALYPPDTPLKAWVAALAGQWPAYLLALAAGVSWGFFSNFSVKYGGGTTSTAMPLFLLAAGISMGVVRLFIAEQVCWTLPGVLELGYLTAGPVLLGGVFWDYAMRRGNVVWVAAASYLTPLLATAICSLYLKVKPGTYLWLACALTIAGAGLCKRSIRERAPG